MNTAVLNTVTRDGVRRTSRQPDETRVGNGMSLVSL